MFPPISEHSFSGLESSSAIYFSDFMNRKMFPPSVFFRPTMKIAEILGDPYSKKSPLPSMDYNLHCPTHVPPSGHYPVMCHLMHVSPLPSMGTSPRLAIPLTDTSYQVLGQSRIQQRNATRYNHPRIHAQ